MHTSDGGGTWIADDPGTNNYLYDIFLIDSTHGWAGGIHGDIVSTIQTGNTPPDEPFNPIPSDGETNINLDPTLSVKVTDPNSDPLTVSFFDASDNSLIGIDNNVESGDRAYIIWNGLESSTTYNWYAVADDGEDTTQSMIWSFSTIGEGNQPPSKPTITGSSEGRPGETYPYIFVTTDPNNDVLYYYIEWGDGTVEEWIGPYYSGEEIEITHAWDEEGSYTIRVKAKDIYGDESDWAYLEVTMPMNQQSVEYPMLELFRERYPLLYHFFLKILNYNMQHL
jgi:hypothetical protein